MPELNSVLDFLKFDITSYTLNSSHTKKHANQPNLSLCASPRSYNSFKVRKVVQLPCERSRLFQSTINDIRFTSSPYTTANILDRSLYHSTTHNSSYRFHSLSLIEEFEYKELSSIRPCNQENSVLQNNFMQNDFQNIKRRKSIHKSIGENKFIWLMKRLFNWSCLKHYPLYKNVFSWFLLIFMVTVFIPQLFCSDVKNYQIKEESLYNDGKESVYTFIQPIRRLYPFSPLGSFTYKSMIKSFAMYGPLLYDTDLTSSIKNQIRAREYNTKCCFDMYDRTAYQTLKGVGCGKYHHIKLFQNGDDGTICGINSRCCHSGDKNNILLPTNVLDYPINIICNKPNFTNSVDEESNCLGLTMIIDNRPCTYGIHGHCHLMNEHKCLWMNGIFHGEAHLCSQVDGISDLTLAGISNSEFILFSLYTRIIMSSISVETIISFVITFFGILHGVVRFEQYNTTIVSAVSYLWYCKLAGIINLLVQPNIPTFTCESGVLGMWIFTIVLNNSKRKEFNRLGQSVPVLIILVIILVSLTENFQFFANITVIIVGIGHARLYIKYYKSLSVYRSTLITITFSLLFLFPFEPLTHYLNLDFLQKYECFNSLFGDCKYLKYLEKFSDQNPQINFMW